MFGIVRKRNVDWIRSYLFMKTQKLCQYIHVNDESFYFHVGCIKKNMKIWKSKSIIDISVIFYDS